MPPEPARAPLPPPVVRPVREADVPAVAAIQVASWQAAYAGIIPAAYLRAMSAAERAARHLARVRDPQPRTAYLLAERDGAVQGMANIGPARDDDLDPAVVGEIRAMYADPGAWSTGVGSALMGAALDHLRAQGFRQVTLWVLEGNGRGRTFYERWGFTDDGSRHVEEIGAPVTELRYSRALP